MTNRQTSARRSRRHGAAPLAAALLALFPAACGDAARTPEGTLLSAPNRPLPVAVAEVTAVDGYDQARTYTGEVKARQTTDVAFEVRGKITALTVDVGTRVTAGQVLGRLDTRRLTARRAEVDARLAQAAANLAEMRAGPRREVIAAARAETRRLEQEERLAELQLKRRRELIADRVASQEDVDIAETRLRTVQAQLAGARSDLLKLENGTRKEQLEAQRALVESLRAQQQQIAVDLDDCELRAPFAGSIAARHYDEGAVIDVGDAVFRLVETGALEAWVGVPPGALAELRRNAADNGGLRLTIAGQEVLSEAPRSLPELDPKTRTATLVFDLPRDLRGVRPGEVVKVRLAQRVATPGFFLPLSALTESGRGMWSCYLLGEPVGDAAAGVFTVQRAEVQVLHVEVDRALVRGTLRPGDRVVRAGTQRIVPGMQVTPAARGSAK